MLKETEPEYLDFESQKTIILLFLVFLGIWKFYFWISRQIALFLFPHEYHQLAYQLGANFGMVLRLMPIILFFWVNRSYLNRYFLTQNFSKQIVITVIISHLFLFLLGMISALTETGTIILRPFERWPSLMITSIYYGVVEELEFRSIMLVQSTLIIAKYYNVDDPEILSSILIIFWFGPLYHLHHLVSGNIIEYILASLFGLFATILTIKTRTIWPAIFLHVSMNFYYSLFM